MAYFSIAIFVTLLSAPRPSEGTITWSRGFPLSVPFTRTAFIHGSARPDAKGVLIRAKVWYWREGSAVQIKDVPIDAKGTLGPVRISGLEPAAEYFVVMKVVQVRNKEEETLATKIAVIKTR